MMDVPDDVAVHEFVPGLEEAVADFDLSLLGDCSSAMSGQRGRRVFFRLFFGFNIVLG